MLYAFVLSSALKRDNVAILTTIGVKIGGQYYGYYVAFKAGHTASPKISDGPKYRICGPRNVIFNNFVGRSAITKILKLL